jgi:hypothetical protein
MASSVKSSELVTDLHVVESAIDACRGHQACTAQVLRLRLELIREHLARRDTAAECGDRDVPVIESALSWFAGIGPAPPTALQRGLVAIRDRLTRRASVSPALGGHGLIADHDQRPANRKGEPARPAAA